MPLSLPHSRIGAQFHRGTVLVPGAIGAQTLTASVPASAELGAAEPKNGIATALQAAGPDWAGLSFALLFLAIGLLVLRRFRVARASLVPVAASQPKPAQWSHAAGQPCAPVPTDPRIRELETANEELENFVYIAAHDLKAPLRTMFDLSEWLLEDNRGKLSAESETYIKMMQQRANSMNGLLADLLDYARSVESEHTPRAVDLGALVADIAFLLDPVRQFEVDVKPADCRLVVPKTPLRHILMNLISNAMQHHDKSFGNISITVEQDDARYRISVSDDGPGIAPAVQDRIFAPFERLGDQSAHSTSGLGLAIVKKILNRFGGRIEVISDPDTQRGAIFRFEMPHFEMAEAKRSPPRSSG